MEKQIGNWTYWLGLACLVVASGWRILNAVGLLLPPNVAPGRGLSYWSFYHGSLLFFATAIASACYAWLKTQKT